MGFTRAVPVALAALVVLGALAGAHAAQAVPPATAAAEQRCPAFTVAVADRVGNLAAGRYALTPFSARRREIACLDAYHAFRSYLYDPGSYDGWRVRRLRGGGWRFLRDGSRGRTGFTATRTGRRGARARPSGPPLDGYDDPFRDPDRDPLADPAPRMRTCHDAARRPFSVRRDDSRAGFPRTDAGGRRGGRYSVKAFPAGRAGLCATAFDVLRSYLYDRRGLKGWRVQRLPGGLARHPGRRFLRRGRANTGFDAYCPHGTASPPRCGPAD